MQPMHLQKQNFQTSTDVRIDSRFILRIEVYLVDCGVAVSDTTGIFTTSPTPVTCADVHIPWRPSQIPNLMFPTSSSLEPTQAPHLWIVEFWWSLVFVCVRDVELALIPGFPGPTKEATWKMSLFFPAIFQLTTCRRWFSCAGGDDNGCFPASVLVMGRHGPIRMEDLRWGTRTTAVDKHIYI